MRDSIADAAAKPPRRRPFARPAAAAAIAFLAIAILLYAFSAPLLAALGRQLVHSDPLERVDAMIVLAPGLDRLMEGAELYRLGYAPIVVLTREQRQPAEQLLLERGLLQSGEERRRTILDGLGVPAHAIVVLDGFVGSTADEARALARWAMTRPVRSVMIVTSPLHTARSRLTFLRALGNLQIKVVVRASTLHAFRSDTWWHSRATLRDGILEWQKLLYYWLVELPRLEPARAGAP